MEIICIFARPPVKQSMQIDGATVDKKIKNEMKKKLPNSKNGRFRRLARPAEPSPPKGSRFDGLSRDSRFHLQNCKNKANLLALLRYSSQCKLVAKHQTRLRVFQLETSFRFRQDESDTICWIHLKSLLFRSPFRHVTEEKSFIERLRNNPVTCFTLHFCDHRLSTNSGFSLLFVSGCPRVRFALFPHMYTSD